MTSVSTCSGPTETVAVGNVPCASAAEELEFLKTRFLAAVEQMSTEQTAQNDLEVLAALAGEFCSIRQRMFPTQGDSVALEKLRSVVPQLEESVATQGQSETGVQVLQIEPGWAGSISALRTTFHELMQRIAESMSKEAQGETLADMFGQEFSEFWQSTSADSHATLFQKCTILLSLGCLEHKALGTFRSPPRYVVELPNVKAFVYPYLVSNRFMNAMILLSRLVAKKLNLCSVDGQELASGSESSWDSPTLRTMIQDSFRAWHVVALTDLFLNALNAEAVTGVSQESMAVSTIVCAVQQPVVLRLEQLLGSSEPGDESDMSLKWDKVQVLELLTHEFCRVWRRMLLPSGEPCTPQGVGRSDEPNAGCVLDSILWGSLLSTDIHFNNGEVLCARQNTLNLNKALDIRSWEDPEATFKWVHSPACFGCDITGAESSQLSRCNHGARRKHADHVLIVRQHTISGRRRQHADHFT